MGEVDGLQVEDVQDDPPVLHVQRVLVEVARVDSPTGERFLIKELPKDDEARSLPVSRALVRRLRQRADVLGLTDGDRLFSTPWGTPISRSYFRQYVWLPALQRARLDLHVTPHDLRHACASWMLAGGADVRAVRDFLGHGTVTTTELYLHPLREADRQAHEAFTRVRVGSTLPRVPHGLSATG
jgi:integrase